MTTTSTESMPPAIRRALEHLAAAGLHFDVVERCDDAACVHCSRDAGLPTAA